uniref:Fatty-acid amide hydrolase 1 n=1 Tax=Crocodylus porosus TaxID=8502 RepID=A0A7M4FJD6_CROPO
MIQEKLRQLLPEVEVDPRAISALLCGSAAAVLVLKWVGRRRIQEKMEEARRTRDLGLERMEQVAWKFKQKNPGVQTSFILSLPLVELAEKLKEGSLSPEIVLYTYIDKALAVTQEVNCVTDFIQGCEEQLRDLTKRKEKGLLYGVPISIKDHIGCKGHISTGGLVQFLGKVEEEDSVIVKVLKRQGAIPFVKTNVPQSMINYDCSNVIFGQTLNPLNHKKSPGGSSGGEGALIAGGGSLLGFGTDVAGSIRLPSSFCGLCGLKPTGNRLSKEGSEGLVTGILAFPIAVMATIGPMARDVDSLVLCMRALLCEDLFQLDPTVPPIPFNEEVYSSSKPLRIGFYDGDGYFQPSPSMKRAVQETKQLLQRAGHTVRFVTRVPAWGLSLKLKGDIMDPNLKSQVNTYRLPVVVKRIGALLLKPVVSPSTFILFQCSSRFVPNAVSLPLQAYRKEFIAKWRKLQLDVILCPALGPAFNAAATSYTNLYNVLNFPAGVVPVTTVTHMDEEELKDYRGHYGDLWDKRLKEVRAVGLPVAVQCVALPWQEELCLRFMKEVETLAHGTRQSPTYRDP